jgi:hypothetical protein
LLLVFADQLEPIFCPVSGTNPVFVLAVYAPGIAAVALVWRHFGVMGLGSFFKRADADRVVGVLASRYSGGEVPRGGHERHD